LGFLQQFLQHQVFSLQEQLGDLVTGGVFVLTEGDFAAVERENFCLGVPSRMGEWVAMMNWEPFFAER